MNANGLNIYSESYENEVNLSFNKIEIMIDIKMIMIMEMKVITMMGIIMIIFWMP